jgi:ABC-type dipeptide/oligopeptide/nickel transport system permease component
LIALKEGGIQRLRILNIAKDMQPDEAAAFLQAIKFPDHTGLDNKNSSRKLVWADKRYRASLRRKYLIQGRAQFVWDQISNSKTLLFCGVAYAVTLGIALGLWARPAVNASRFTFSMGALGEIRAPSFPIYIISLMLLPPVLILLFSPEDYLTEDGMALRHLVVALYTTI